MKKYWRGLIGVCVVICMSGYSLFQLQAFTDLNPENEKTTAIIEFSERGLINGYSDGTFRGEASITRAEFIALINRTFNFTLQKENKPSFQDVNPNGWYYQDLKIAIQEGYIKGYVDNTFRPQRYISRQEAAVVINRILKLVPQKYIELEEEIPSWARDDVFALIYYGIIFVENGYFYGAVNITREDTVVSLLTTLKQQEAESENIDKTSDETGQGGSVPETVNPTDPLAPTNEVIYAMQVTIEGLNRVLQKTNRYAIQLDSNQLTMVMLIRNNMTNYLADYSYDYEGHAQEVNTMYRALSDAQQQTLKNSISFEVAAKYLTTLENYFKKG